MFHDLQLKILPLAATRLCLVLLQNIHLVARWLGTLEKLLEQHAEGSHQSFRVFVSAEPSSTPEGHIIPQGILENSIKITNEPPTGMHANLHQALDNFNQVRSTRGLPASQLCPLTLQQQFSSWLHVKKITSQSFGLGPDSRHRPMPRVDLILLVWHCHHVDWL